MTGSVERSAKAAMVILLTVMASPSSRAETVYQPGHRTWTNSYVPPHYESRPDTRYVPPKDAAPIGPQANPKPAAPPNVSIYTPPPFLDPYYGALNAASRPLPPPKPPAGGQR
jgi:hypothetical protein